MLEIPLTEVKIFANTVPTGAKKPRGPVVLTLIWTVPAVPFRENTPQTQDGEDALPF